MMKETDRGALAWKHVSLTFNPRWQRPGQRPHVLDDVSGYAQVGELSLMLGSSGSGKTSLLMALAGALTSKKFGLSGELSLHGSIARCGRKKQVGVAFITQQDMLFSHLTVRETLDLAALFFMDNSTHAQRTIRVKAVLRELGLTSVQNVMVGSDTKRGVSGGERKRVAIAREMISAPKILLADELTSGLDSFNAANVIESLQSLAQAGRIVICAIHQPRSAIFNMFERVTVLSQGRLQYFGERRNLAPFLAAAGFPCPSTFNMADHIVDVVTLDERTPESQLSSQARIDKLANAVSKEHILNDIDAFARLDDEGEGDGDEGGGSPDLEESKDEQVPAQDSSPKPSFFSRISGEESKTSDSSGQGRDCGSIVRHYLVLVVVLFLRAGLKNIRLWKEWLIQLTVLLMLAAIVSLLFYQTDSASLVQDRLGLLFFVVINQSFGPCLDAARTFQSEKVIVKAEIVRGGYLMSAYFISRFLSTLPFALINATLYSTVVYFSVGFKLDAGAYFIFLGIVSLLTVTSQSFGLLLSSLTSSETVASSLATPFLIIFVLSGGFYLNKESFPSGAGWLVYTSLCYYGFIGLAINEFSGATFACTGSYNAQLQTSETSAPCKTNGDKVLLSLGFANNSILEAFVGLLLLTILFLGLSFSALVVLKERSLVMQKPLEHQQQEMAV
jgi:ATP-binding cassette subfamily G (WHITE) protein 2